MNRGPVPGTSTGADFVVKAHAAWGEPPEWVLALAEEASRTTLKAAASRIGYSAPVVSQVISATYHRGSLPQVEERVRGALMGLVVDCPILGEIGRDRCLDHQRGKLSTASPVSVKLYHACRSGCRHAAPAGQTGAAS